MTPTDREAVCPMGDESFVERLVRLETKVDGLEVKVDALNKGLNEAKMLERILRLEFEMKVIKWFGGAAQAVLLLVIGYLIKDRL